MPPLFLFRQANQLTASPRSMADPQISRICPDKRDDIVTKVPIEAATGRQLGRQSRRQKQAVDALAPV
jgi:hypothetical protein